MPAVPDHFLSGSFKGHGYSTDLLNECIDDSKAKGRKGLCILAAAKKKPFHAIHIISREEAQNAPTPVTNYALFHDGQYITNEQMNDKKFLKLIKGMEE